MSVTSKINKTNQVTKNKEYAWQIYSWKFYQLETDHTIFRKLINVFYEQKNIADHLNI